MAYAFENMKAWQEARHWWLTSIGCRRSNA